MRMPASSLKNLTGSTKAFAPALVVRGRLKINNSICRRCTSPPAQQIATHSVPCSRQHKTIHISMIGDDPALSGKRRGGCIVIVHMVYAVCAWRPCSKSYAFPKTRAQAHHTLSFQMCSMLLCSSSSLRRQRRRHSHT